MAGRGAGARLHNQNVTALPLSRPIRLRETCPRNRPLVDKHYKPQVREYIDRMRAKSLPLTLRTASLTYFGGKRQCSVETATKLLTPQSGLLNLRKVTIFRLSIHVRHVGRRWLIFIRSSETMAIIFVTVQNAIAMCLWTQVRYFSVKHLYFLELGIGRM